MPSPNTASRFDEIYDSTNKAVLTYITAKCRYTADINDIFQETYVEFYGVLIKCKADYIKNEKAFVLKIAKRKIAKYYSLMEKLRIFISLTPIDENDDEVDLSYFEADSILMEDYVVNQVMLETAWQYINTKAEIVQKVFYLMFNVGLTIPEIAKALSMSESNVKNKLYRTLKELRKLLK